MRLTLLSSSYPRYLNDHMGCFVRDLASEVAQMGDIQIKVVAPEDATVRPVFNEKRIEVRRFRYFFPSKWQCLACGDGIPENLDKSLLAWLEIPLFMLSYIFHAWQAVRSSDIIWAHWLLPSGLIGAILKFLLGKPLVVTVHSGDVHFARRIVFGRTLLKFVIRQADCITVVCDFVRRELNQLLSEDDEKLLEERLETIPMGVRPLRRIETLSDSRDLVILYLGRLVKIKGVEVLIEALSDLKEKINQPVKLWIIGEGREKNRLRCLAAEKQIRTTFLGSLGGNRKMSALQRADIVVIPSLMLESRRTEGLPVTLLEALSSGRAIIASEVGGIPEVIRDGWNGLLVPPGNIRRLTQCLAELIENPGKRKSLGKNAMLTSRDFNLTRIGDRFVNIFTNLYPGNHARLETSRLPLKVRLPGNTELITK